VLGTAPEQAQSVFTNLFGGSAPQQQEPQSIWSGALSLTRTQRVYGFFISVVCKLL